MKKRTSLLLLAWAFLGLVLVIIGSYLADSRYLNGFGCAMAVTVLLVNLLERRRQRAS